MLKSCLSGTSLLALCFATPAMAADENKLWPRTMLWLVTLVLCICHQLSFGNFSPSFKIQKSDRSADAPEN